MLGPLARRARGALAAMRSALLALGLALTLRDACPEDQAPPLREDAAALAGSLSPAAAPRAG